MTVKTLADLKKEFIKTYYSISSGKVLLDLIFTDYKNAPTELKSIPALEVLAKQKVSQIVDATAIPTQVVQDFFTLVQQIIIIDANELEALQDEIAAAQLDATNIDPIEGDTGAPGSGLDASLDSGGFSGGG